MCAFVCRIRVLSCLNEPIIKTKTESLPRRKWLSVFASVVKTLFILGCFQRRVARFFGWHAVLFAVRICILFRYGFLAFFGIGFFYSAAMARPAAPRSPASFLRAAARMGVGVRRSCPKTSAFARAAMRSKYFGSSFESPPPMSTHSG